jgi:hypothetical protein
MMTVLTRLGAGMALGILLLTSCSTLPGAPPALLDFFVPAPPDDPWNRKVRTWQARHHLDPAASGGVIAEDTPIARKYRKFTRELRRSVVSETVEWVQTQSRLHYRADGGSDHWATLGEVVESGGDDCDGLDLLTFVLLRRLGFEEGELYRAILVEAKTDQHHMVTLWFEDGRRQNADPYVLDPTGVVMKGMARLSAAAAWQPIELFDENAHYRVEKSPTRASVAGR